ncbi:MAG: orotidine-5'-phosphate decarboxylase [Anaerolineae bacterium]|nr:orotidine-5'-phosphate decarboxylase [Anaerolineae bacterium]
MTFRDKLCAAQKNHQSWLCVGLDPDPAQMPVMPGLNDVSRITTFCQAIVEATHDLVCAFKPNLAFFLAHGSEGLRALKETIRAVPDDVPVVLDAKLGDIGNTQRLYGQAVFGAFDADAVTISPYMGEDVIIPLLDAYPGRGVYVVCRSSNPDGGRFQDHPGHSPYLYEQVATAAQGWAQTYPQSVVGLVVGATQPDEMVALREITPELPFLIPGVGAQGGSLDVAVRYGAPIDGPGPLINVSRGVLYASKRADYASAARDAATRLRDDINQLRESTKDHQDEQA